MNIYELPPGTVRHRLYRQHWYDWSKPSEIDQAAGVFCEDLVLTERIDPSGCACFAVYHAMTDTLYISYPR